MHNNVIPIQAVAADSAYDLPLDHRVLEELGIDFFVVPQPAHDRTKAEFKRDVFTYHGQRDVYLWPKRLYRSDSGLFWEYWADRWGCACCPLREKCLNETDKAWARKLQDSYFKHAVQRHFSRRWEPACREALKKRQIWCEGTFAAQKWGHNLTCVLRRGLEAAEDHSSFPRPH